METPGDAGVVVRVPVSMSFAVVEFGRRWCRGRGVVGVGGVRPTATRTTSAGSDICFAFPFEGDGEFTALFLGAGDLGLGVDIEALFFEDLFEAAGHFFIAAGDEGGEHFEDGDLGAEAGPDGAELEADGAAADDDHGGGDFVESDGLVGADDAFAVEFQEGEFDGGGAGGEDDVYGGEFAGSVGAFDGDFAGGAGEFGGADDFFDLVFLHEGGDAGGEGFDDLVFAGHHGGEVDAGGCRR